jgi:trehalose 6-phosphate phosphatase
VEIPGRLPLLRGRDLLRLVEPDLGSRPLLLVSDFDGTLSRIVMDPWGAEILPGARAALRRLAGVPGVHVAFLSGRSATDLAARVRVGGALYVGNHGLDRGALARGARAETIAVAGDPALAAYLEDAERLAREVPRSVSEPWLIVERKGPAVAFHFRAAPDVGAARARVLEAVARLDPRRRLVAIPGRRIVELRPPGAPAKGDALRALVRDVQPALTWVLGDDDSDAEAFRVLRELREGGLTAGLSVAVHAHPEMPEAVAAWADVALAAPEESARFLTRVARLICAAGDSSAR